MDIKRITNLIEQKGEPCVEYTIDELEPFKDFLKQEKIKEYLSFCLTNEGCMASGIYLGTLDRLLGENMPDVSPGGFINPYGYLVIGTSVGGNAVCFDSNTGHVYWADHSSYSEYRISYKDAETGDWVNLPFAPENIEKALVLLDSDIESFLDKLLKDELEDFLDKLD